MLITIAKFLSLSSSLWSVMSPLNTEPSTVSCCRSCLLTFAPWMLCCKIPADGSPRVSAEPGPGWCNVQSVPCVVSHSGLSPGPVSANHKPGLWHGWPMGAQDSPELWSCPWDLRVSVTKSELVMRCHGSHGGFPQHQLRVTTKQTYLKYVCLRAREPLQVDGGRSKDSRRSSQAFLLFT